MRAEEVERKGTVERRRTEMWALGRRAPGHRHPPLLRPHRSRRPTR